MDWKYASISLASSLNGIWYVKQRVKERMNNPKSTSARPTKYSIRKAIGIVYSNTQPFARRF